jgi:hypothetical protein
MLSLSARGLKKIGYVLACERGVSSIPYLARGTPEFVFVAIMDDISIFSN